MEKEYVIQHLTDTNEPQYNLLKAVEELTELSEVLLKRVLKGDRIPNKPIIEEIGDVEIRLEILKNIFGRVECATRVDEKLSKYLEYIQQGKYKERI